MKINRLTIIILGLIYILPITAQIQWLNNKKAAIVLTYDDGLASQQKYAMPQLESAGFNGTFFLYGLTLKAEEMSLWQQAAARGHEIGNHSLFHPCQSENKDSISTRCYSLDCYTIKDMLSEISIMNSTLSLIDGKAEHSYAYPCGQSCVSNGDYGRPLLESGMAHYARGAGNTIITNTTKLDYAHIPAYAFHTGMNLDEIISTVNETVEKGGLCVFVFHGVGGDYLSISAEDHQQLISYLKKRKNEIWIATFSEVLNYLSNTQKQTALKLSKRNDSVEVNNDGEFVVYKSPFYALAFAKEKPMLSYLGIESGGRSHHYMDRSLLRPGIGGTPHNNMNGIESFYQTIYDEKALSYTSTKKKLHSYSFVMDDSHHFKLNVESKENFIEGEFFRIATAPDISPVSVWAEKNKINPSNEYDRVNNFYTPAIMKASYKLPAVLHFPDYGLIQIEANENEVYLQEHIVPDETNTGLSLGPYNRGGHTVRKAIHHGAIMLSFHAKEPIKEAHIHFTVLDENYPHIAGCDLSDKKYNGLKRCWQNVFTLNPNNQTMGDNILLEGVGHLSLPYKADLLPFTPELTGSFTMREALKRSIEIALQERIGADGRIIDFGWECTETTQIAIYDYLISTNNWEFIKQYLPQIKQLINGTLNADIDHDGIIESPFSGNQYSSARSSWNWWDDFAFGYKDAYTNLMAYRGLTCMHKIFFKLGLKEEADSIQAHLDLFKKNFHNTFFNPATGMYAGWISQDGEIHDYQFTFISSTAINLGLVPHKLSLKIMMKMLKKMKQEGYDYKYGIPGPLIPVDPKDKGTWDEMSRWGRYENGGLCGQTAYHFIQALYKIGMRDEADTILFTMLNTYEKEYTHSGVFPGYLRSVDWRTKGGEPTGYNYLADNYYFLLAAITGHFNIPFPELKEPE